MMKRLLVSLFRTASPFTNPAVSLILKQFGWEMYVCVPMVPQKTNISQQYLAIVRLQPLLPLSKPLLADHYSDKMVPIM